MKHKFIHDDNGKPVIYTEAALAQASKIKKLMSKLTYVGSAPDFDSKGNALDEKGKESKIVDMRTRFQSSGISVEKPAEEKKGSKGNRQPQPNKKKEIPGDEDTTESPVTEEDEK